MDIAKLAAGMAPRQLVFGCLFAVSNRAARVLDAAAPELTAKQWWLLAMLSLFEAPPTLGELADASDTSHQNTRQIAGRLADKGFVRLVADDADARATRVVATKKAARWAEETEEEAERFMEAVFEGLSEEGLRGLADSLLLLHASLGRVEKRRRA